MWIGNITVMAHYDFAIKLRHLSCDIGREQIGDAILYFTQAEFITI
jgi:hypothetical protein